MIAEEEKAKLSHAEYALFDDLIDVISSYHYNNLVITQLGAENKNPLEAKYDHSENLIRARLQFRNGVKEQTHIEEIAGRVESFARERAEKMFKSLSQVTLEDISQKVIIQSGRNY